MKVCSRCFTEKPLDEFGVHPTGRLGRQSRCRSCMTEAARERRAANPAPSRAANQRSYRKRQVADPGRQARQSAAWRAANPDRQLELSREYVANRRSRQLGAFVEHVDRQVVWDRDGGLCHICGGPADPADWHLDHVRPLARGGDHSYANTAVSHPLCNWRKSDAWPWASLVFAA